MHKVKIKKYRDCFAFREICENQRTFEVEITAEDEEHKTRIVSALQGIACLTNGELRILGEDCYQMIPGMSYIGDILSRQTMDKMSFVIQTKEDLNLAAETLKSGHPVCVDLSQMLKAEARKAFDSLSSMDYYLMGQIEKVDTDIFLYTPKKKVYTEAENQHSVILANLDRAKALYQEEDTSDSWMREFTQVFAAAVEYMKENQIISPVALIYAQLLEEIGETDAAIDVLKDYADWCETGSMHLHDYHVIALRKIATHHYRNKKCKVAEKYLELLTSECVRKKLEKGENDFYRHSYVNTLVDNNKRQEAKQYLKHCLKSCKDPEERTWLTERLAGLYSEEGVFWKAMNLYKKSEKLADVIEKRIVQNRMLLRAKMGLVEIYIKKGKKEKVSGLLDELEELYHNCNLSNTFSISIYQKLGDHVSKLKESGEDIVCSDIVPKWYEETGENFALISPEIFFETYQQIEEQRLIQRQYDYEVAEFDEVLEQYRSMKKSLL